MHDTSYPYPVPHLNKSGRLVQTGVNGVNPFFEVCSVNFLYSSFMKHKLDSLITLACAGLLGSALAADTTTAPKESVFPTKPLGITLSVKMVGPYMLPATLTRARRRIPMLICTAFSRRCAIATSSSAKAAKRFSSLHLKTQSPRS